MLFVFVDKSVNFYRKKKYCSSFLLLQLIHTSKRPQLVYCFIREKSIHKSFNCWNENTSSCHNFQKEYNFHCYQAFRWEKFKL